MEKCPRCHEEMPAGKCPQCGDSGKNSRRSLTSELHSLKDRQLGPYKIKELIAEGGMGRIYKGLHTTLFKSVAIKVLSLEQAFRDPRVLERFIQEAQLTAKLKHPNIATVYHAGSEDGTYYIAMDLIEGKTLAKIIEQKSLSVKDTLQIIIDIAGALDYAHRRQIVHRDVKPGNIMLDENNFPFIMDFGLAKDTRFNLALTQVGSVIGSPHYMSPEQAQGKKLDCRSDIFSLGSVFYEMLTFCKPFEGKSSLDVIQKVISANPVPIRKITPHVHKDVETICSKCLEKAPSARYQSAAEIVQDIQSFLRGEIIHARPAKMLYRLGKWMKRNKLVATVFVIGLCFIIFVPVILTVVYRRHENERLEQKQKEVYNLLRLSSKRIADEIENAWFSTLTDARVMARTEELTAIIEQEHPVENDYRKALATLRIWRETKGYLAIFLLNENGRCTISTNKKFERENYGFRPYFQRAQAGEENIFYAIGTTSHTPGYYCAVPSYRGKRLVGVCVIKFSLKPISRIINRVTIFKSEKIFLSEANGILIQANDNDTPLLTLGPLSKNRLAEINSTRQFLGQMLAPLGLQLDSFPDLKDEQLLMVKDKSGLSRLLIITPLEKFSYTIIRLIDYRELRRLCKNLSRS